MVSLTSAAAVSERKILTFHMSGQTFAIPMSSLVELREWEEPTPVPGAPAFIRGVINLRGTVLPIVDLAERLGNGTTAVHPRSCVMIADAGGKRTGFLVDGVEDIVNVSAQSFQAPPSVHTDEPDIVSAVVDLASDGRSGEENCKSRTALVLDLDAMRIHAAIDADPNQVSSPAG